jgi:pimeloyl-ACP methyl ester carboxylesterase
MIVAQRMTDRPGSEGAGHHGTPGVGIPDSAHIASVFAHVEGPVVAVGHSYGGAIMSKTATSSPDAVGLVFVSGCAPEENEKLSDAWKTLPSWATVATGDKAAGADVTLMMAKRANSQIDGQPMLTLHEGDPFLMPTGQAHNALDVGPGTGMMVFTYIVEIGRPQASFVHVERLSNAARCQRSRRCSAATLCSSCYVVERDHGSLARFD